MLVFVLVAFLYIVGPKGVDGDPELQQQSDVYSTAEDCSDAALKLEADMHAKHPKDFMSFSFTCNALKAPEPPKES